MKKLIFALLLMLLGHLNAAEQIYYVQGKGLEVRLSEDSRKYFPVTPFRHREDGVPPEMGSFSEVKASDFISMSPPFYFTNFVVWCWGGSSDLDVELRLVENGKEAPFALAMMRSKDGSAGVTNNVSNSLVVTGSITNLFSVEIHNKGKKFSAPVTFGWAAQIVKFPNSELSPWGNPLVHGTVLK